MQRIRARGNLSEHQIADILRMYEAGTRQQDIADRMGLCLSTVSRRINSRKTYKPSKKHRCPNCRALIKTTDCIACKARRTGPHANDEIIRELRRKTRRENIKKNGYVRAREIPTRPPINRGGTVSRVAAENVGRPGNVRVYPLE